MPFSSSEDIPTENIPMFKQTIPKQCKKTMQVNKYSILYK